MRSIPIPFAATLLTTAALAQTTAPDTSGSAFGATSNAPMAGVNPSTGTTPGTGMVDRNQAVATTNDNATQPAQGFNSFSMSQARHRIAHHGFAKVAGPRRENGVWHGTGMKDGQ